MSSALICCCSPAPTRCQTAIPIERRPRTRPNGTHQRLLQDCRPLDCQTQSDEVEEIELKCYNLSENLMLLDGDRRFFKIYGQNNSSDLPLGSGQWICEVTNSRLRARPIGSLEDGRKFLDTPISISNANSIRLEIWRQKHRSSRTQILFKELKRHHTSGAIDDADKQQQQRANSIDELALWSPDGDWPRPPSDAKEAAELAEQMSLRSFVLVERPKQQQQQQQTETTHATAKGPDLLSSESASTRIEDEFISSIGSSSENSRRAMELVEELPDYKKPRRKFRLRITKKISRLFGRQSAAQDTAQTSASSPLVADQKQQVSCELSVHSEPVASAPVQMIQSTQSPPGQRQHGARSPVKFGAMISYNRSEAQPHACKLYDQLKRLGVNVYLDLVEIKSGLDWQDSLNWAIINCDLFIALVTPSYGKTLWTSRELKLADMLGKRIIPINFQAAWPPESLAIQFASKQFIHFRPSENHTPFDWQTNDEFWPANCVQSVAKKIQSILLDEESEELRRTKLVDCQQSHCFRSHLDSGYDSPTSCECRQHIEWPKGNQSAPLVSFSSSCNSYGSNSTKIYEEHESNIERQHEADDKRDQKTRKSFKGRINSLNKRVRKSFSLQASKVGA